MIWQREAVGNSYEEVARSLCVDKATVWRTVALFHSTGKVSKKPYPKEKAHKKLTAPAQTKLQQTLLVDVSISTICRFLQNSGFTRQKLQITALQRDEFLRQKYRLDMSVYSPEMLVFVDETGADLRNAIRRYGYSIRGKPLTSQVMLARGERVSAIACISVSGLLDVMTVKGTTNGDDFYTFVQAYLLPHLMPFNGVNPHSVVILDNCAIHHVVEIASIN